MSISLWTLLRSFRYVGKLPILKASSRCLMVRRRLLFIHGWSFGLRRIVTWGKHRLYWHMRVLWNISTMSSGSSMVLRSSQLCCVTHWPNWRNDESRNGLNVTFEVLIGLMDWWGEIRTAEWSPVDIGAHIMGCWCWGLVVSTLSRTEPPRVGCLTICVVRVRCSISSVWRSLKSPRINISASSVDLMISIVSTIWSTIYFWCGDLGGA